MQPSSVVTTPSVQLVVNSFASLGVEGMTPWILDSGATEHVASSLSWFISYQHVQGMFVSLLDKYVLTVPYIRMVKFSHTLVLHNVLFVPEFTYNLISASKLTTDSACFLILHSIECIIQNLESKKKICTIGLRHGLYHVDVAGFHNSEGLHGASVLKLDVSAAVSSTNNLWHYKISAKNLQVLANKYFETVDDHLEIFDSCH